MKKVLTKDDVLAYLESLPEATWAKVRDAVAPATVKKLMLDDLRARGSCSDPHDAYYSFLTSAMLWRYSPVGSVPWGTLRDSIPSGLGIDIPNPSSVLDIAFVPGMVVRMKTLEELRATPGVHGAYNNDLGYERDCGIVFSPGMATMCGKASTILSLGNNTTRGKVKDASGREWTLAPWMVKEVIYDPANPKPYISDPDDPRVSGLIGKKVYYSDYMDTVLGTKRTPAYLVKLNTEGGAPFGIGSTLDHTEAYFGLIRPVEEPKVEEMTVEQICKALGKTVKIVKHQDAEE